MTSPEPPQEFDPAPGVPEELEPDIRRVLASNPSPMTFRGTNTYIVGRGEVCVIDPGPADQDHYHAVLNALRPGERVVGILVTHSHLDHSPLAAPLAEFTGAPVLAFGDSAAGRSDVMEALVADGLTGGGEGVDAAFKPDDDLGDGDVLDFGDFKITALRTPGHFGNHMSFALGDRVFTGDHVMGWASTMISPPDGDLTAFMASVESLAARADRVFYPGHGAPIHDPAERLRWLADHRRGREREIHAALSDQPRTVSEIAREVYMDTPPALLPAAERNAFAHLVDLCHQGRAVASPRVTARDARFARIP